MTTRMPAHLWLVSCLFGFILPAAGIVHAATDEGPPLLDSIDKYESPQEYVRIAMAYLEKPGDNSWKPRVAYDLLVHATLTENGPLKACMQAFLLGECSESKFAQYLLLSLKEPDIREIVRSIMTQRGHLTGSVWGRRARGVVKQGWDKFPSNLFDESLARTAALLGIVEGDPDLVQISLQWLEDHDKDPGEVVSIALNQEQSDIQKIESLIPLAEHPNARYLQQHLLTRCANDDQHQSLRARVELVNLAIDGRMSEAIPLFERLPAWREDPQLVFLHYWGLIAARRPDEAQDDYRLLRREHSDSPWTRRAAELTACMQHKDEIANTLADWTQRVEQSLREGQIDLIELELEITGEREAYIAMAPNSMFFDVAVFSQHRQIFRLRRDRRWLQLYSESWGSQINEWDVGYEAGATLGIVPRFTFSEDEQGEFNFRLGVNVGGPAGSGPATNLAITESRRFLQPDCLSRFLEWSLRKGHYCVIQSQGSGDQVIRLGVCNPISPDEREFRFVLSDSGLIKEFESDDVRCRRIRWGRRGDFLLAAPRWPNAPTRRMNTPYLPTLLMVGMQLASEAEQMRSSTR